MPILLSVYTSRMPCDHAIQNNTTTHRQSHASHAPHTHARARPAPARDPRSCNKMTPIPNSRARARVPHVTSTHAIASARSRSISRSFVRSNARRSRASQNTAAPSTRSAHPSDRSDRSRQQNISHLAPRARRARRGRRSVGRPITTRTTARRPPPVAHGKSARGRARVLTRTSRRRSRAKRFMMPVIFNKLLS